MAKDDPVIVPDDGLPCPKVGSWTETKHDYVSYYAKLFSSGMKHKWGKRIYVDLYAGAGYSGIRDTPRIKFLAEEFAASMEALGYLPTPIHKMKRVRSDEKNLPLYYIAMFSGHPLAHSFWDDVLKYGTDQTTFAWD